MIKSRSMTWWSVKRTLRKFIYFKGNISREESISGGYVLGGELYNNKACSCME
jgi:hypothetical protein